MSDADGMRVPGYAIAIASFALVPQALRWPGASTLELSAVSWLAIGAALLWSCAPVVERRSPLERLRSWGGRCVLALGVAFALRWIATPLEWRAPNFSPVARLAAMCLAPLVPTTWNDDGLLAMRTYEGLLLVSPTPEKLALVPWLCFVGVAGSFAVRSRRPWLALSALGVWTTLGVVLRFAFVCLRFSDRDDLLQQPGAAGLLEFESPLLTWCWLLGTGCAWLATCARLGFGLDPEPRRAVQDASAAVRSPLTARRFALSACALAFALATLSAGLLIHPRGVRSAGRVLVDDTLSESWEPASRLLDWDWFGDYSTYSFSTAVEGLGYPFAVSVNADRPYTRELLAAYDVVLLKTPARDLPAEQEAALLEFAREGGSLVLVSDHTDLMGMSRRLNRIAGAAGIRFRADSVLELGTGNFTDYERPAWAPHPVLRDVRELRFMTSCSLALDRDARAVLVAPGQSREDHDWSDSSHFGRLRSDPKMDSGPLVLAAEGRIGRGRVLAFSDSTILSSFALYLHGRERFLNGCIEYASTRPGSEAARWCLALLGCVSAASIAWSLARCATSSGVGAAIGFALLVGPPVGSVIASELDAAAYPEGRALEHAPRVALWLPGAESVFPDALGSVNEQELDWAYDTLVTNIARTGVLPLLTSDSDEAREQPGLLVLNPSAPLADDSVDRLESWIDEGHVLIVACRSDHLHADAVASWLKPFGSSMSASGPGAASVGIEGLDERSSPTPRMRLFERAHGRGSVVLVVGTEWWSRERLGHAFDIPDADQRAAMAVLELALAPLRALHPPHRPNYRILEQ